MITRLSIQDLAIIEQLQIEFSPGFNVITGETGAGKSILIRALHFLMGAKASADTIRSGAEQASVIGEFVVPENHPALFSLANLGIPVESHRSGAAILVRRQVSTKGRSQAWINDVPVTGQPLREVGMLLMDVFGQHENQRLMDSAHHLDYVDDFIVDKGAMGRLARLATECSIQVDELRQFVARYLENNRNQDYLSFRVEELEKFDPSIEDYEATKALCEGSGKRAAGKELVSQALRLLEDSDSDFTVAKNLKEVSRLLLQLSDKLNETSDAKQLRALSEKADQLAVDTDELNYELSRRESDWDVDENELEAAQSRDYGYHDLFRKFAVKDIEGLMSEADRMRKELSSVEEASEKVASALKNIEKRTKELRATAKEISELRQKAAKKIKQRVEAELQALSMPGARIDIVFDPVKRAISPLDLATFAPEIQKQWSVVAEDLSVVGERGAERAHMLLASNPGEPLLPLSKIASGGELSRILLAFKKSLAADADTCVLVFDEIDTGISGRVADVVGNKLRELSDLFQVICISHLPQVAVYADSHFLVEKIGKKNRTESTIVKLSRDQSAREIARLLSGSEVSAPSLVNAKNLIEKARKSKRLAEKGARHQT